MNRRVAKAGSLRGEKKRLPDSSTDVRLPGVCLRCNNGNMATFGFTHAMCIYLGGDPTTGAIQVGGGEERLAAAYGNDAQEIKTRLDALLRAVITTAPHGFTSDGLCIADWLASELPSLSVVCRSKIEAHALYHILH